MYTSSWSRESPRKEFCGGILSGVEKRERVDKRRDYNCALGTQLHVTIPGVASVLMG